MEFKNSVETLHSTHSIQFSGHCALVRHNSTSRFILLKKTKKKNIETEQTHVTFIVRRYTTASRRPLT